MRPHGDLVFHPGIELTEKSSIRNLTCTKTARHIDSHNGRMDNKDDKVGENGKRVNERKESM